MSKAMSQSLARSQGSATLQDVALGWPAQQQPCCGPAQSILESERVHEVFTFLINHGSHG